MMVRVCSVWPTLSLWCKKFQIEGGTGLGGSSARDHGSATTMSSTGGGPSCPLTSDEVSIVREVREEYERRGGFVRIFPSCDSWEVQ